MLCVDGIALAREPRRVEVVGGGDQGGRFCRPPGIQGGQLPLESATAPCSRDFSGGHRDKPAECEPNSAHWLQGARRHEDLPWKSQMRYGGQYHHRCRDEPGRPTPREKRAEGREEDKTSHADEVGPPARLVLPQGDPEPHQEEPEHDDEREEPESWVGRQRATAKRLRARLLVGPLASTSLRRRVERFNDLMGLRLFRERSRMSCDGSSGRRVAGADTAQFGRVCPSRSGSCARTTSQ